MKNGAANKYQHRKNCGKYQNQLAVKQVVEPRAIGKNQRKSKKFVSIFFFFFSLYIYLSHTFKIYFPKILFILNKKIKKYVGRVSVPMEPKDPLPKDFTWYSAKRKKK